MNRNTTWSLLNLLRVESSIEEQLQKDMQKLRDKARRDINVFRELHNRTKLLNILAKAVSIRLKAMNENYEVVDIFESTAHRKDSICVIYQDMLLEKFIESGHEVFDSTVNTCYITYKEIQETIDANNLENL